MEKKITLVKNISNLSEARYCAGMLVDYISFELNSKNEHYVEFDKYLEINGWVNGLKILGNGQNLSFEEIKEQILLRDLDGFIFELPQFEFINKIDCEIKIGLLSINQLEGIDYSKMPNLNYILIFGKKEDLSFKIERFKVEVPILIGFDFDNINLKFEKIKGFAFYGTLETKPGFSSYNNLMDTLELLEDL